jgi:uncharacterized membrane protein
MRAYIPVVCVAAIFVVLFGGLFFFSDHMGVSVEIRTMAVMTTILGLVSTLLAFLLSVSHALKIRQGQEREEQRQIYLAAGRFVASELDENAITLEELRDAMGRDYVKEHGLDHNGEFSRMQMWVGIFSGTAEDCIANLDERAYTGLIASGALVRIRDRRLADNLHDAYVKIKRLKIGMARILAWCRSMSSSRNSEDALHKAHVQKMASVFPAKIELTKKEIEETIAACRQAIDVLNGALKPLGMQFKQGEEPEPKSLL